MDKYTLSYLPLNGDIVDEAGLTWNLNGSTTWKNGNNPLILEGKSLHLNGSADYLECQEMANIFNTIGTKDFTLEFWIYHVTNHEHACIIATRNDASLNSNMLIACFNASPAISLANDNSDSWSVETYGHSTSFTANLWNHFAVSKSNGVLRVFINGQSYYETSAVSKLNGTIFQVPFYIGNRHSTYYGSYLNQSNNSISHFRLSSVGRYKQSFNPYTAWYQAYKEDNILKVY